MATDSESQQILAGLDRHGTIGMGYLGVVFSSLIYGITCIQTFQYYRSERGQRDQMLTRSFVMIVWVLDTVHQVMAVDGMYGYLVTDWGYAPALLYSVWTIPMSILVNTIIFALVRAFYLVRIWRVTHNIYWTVILGVLALARAAISIGYPIIFMRYPIFTTAEAKSKGMGVAALALEVACNVLFTGTLVVYLYRGRTGLKSTDSMVTKIIAVVISTSMLSVFIAVADLILYITEPTKMYTLFFDYIIETVDINAALTSLNSRAYIGKKSTEANTTVQFNTIPLSTFDAGGTRRGQIDSSAGTGTESDEMRGGSPGMAVKIDMEKGSYVV